MKFCVNVSSENVKLKELVQKAVTDYLWLHQDEYFGRPEKKIEINVVIDVTQRIPDQGVS